MATSIIANEACVTTLIKAKEIRPLVEKLITLGREDSLSARRQAYSFLFKKEVVKLLFDEVGPRFKNRPGGYCRIIKLGNRPGDSSQMAEISLVE
jgi:large subunit ribosomal protein L17